MTNVVERDSYAHFKEVLHGRDPAVVGEEDDLIEFMAALPKEDPHNVVSVSIEMSDKSIQSSIQVSIPIDIVSNSVDGVDCTIEQAANYLLSFLTDSDMYQDETIESLSQSIRDALISEGSYALESSLGIFKVDVA